MSGKNTPEHSSMSIGRPEVGPCRQIFETQEQVRKFFDDFREAVGPDLQLLAEARRKGELKVRRGDL